jgi:multidrug efflux pump subunit AcrB
MWIVYLALRRPYTFIVAALLLLIISPVVILRTPTDIFPNIDIPVVSIVWQYTGLSPHQFEGNITWPYERSLTTTVNNIEHIESQTMNGISVVKVFFQPNAKHPEVAASGRHAAAGDQLQCVQRAGAPVGIEQRQALGTAAQ